MINILKWFEEDNLDNPFANSETNDDGGTDNLRLVRIDLGELHVAELLWVRSAEFLVEISSTDRI